jgi:hypothetical protein
VMEECPVPCILGVYFLSFAQMTLNFRSPSCAFAFKHSQIFQFDSVDFSKLHVNIFPFGGSDLGRLAACCPILDPV